MYPNELNNKNGTHIKFIICVTNQMDFFCYKLYVYLCNYIHVYMYLITINMKYTQHICVLHSIDRLINLHKIGGYIFSLLNITNL